jgi:hypothetical protein
MRAFIVACAVAIVIATGAAVALNELVQESSSILFHVCRPALIELTRRFLGRLQSDGAGWLC